MRTLSTSIRTISQLKNTRRKKNAINPTMYIEYLKRVRYIIEYNFYKKKFKKFVLYPSMPTPTPPKRVKVIEINDEILVKKRSNTCFYCYIIHFL